MPTTRTYEDFMKFLGANPARLGIVSTLYDQYTATHLTEALMNTYTMEKGKKGFQSINSFLIEWDLQTKKIKRVPLVAAPEGSGLNAGDVKFYFPENYYQKYDTFVVERTRQQFIVLNRPQRLRDNCWLVIAKILDNDYDSVVDPSTAAGFQTRFVTNYVPELHSEGYTKYQSNCEKMRTYIATHRCDIDMSAMYKPMEDVFIQIGKGSDDDPVYKMNTAEKDCLDSFMEARNNALLWGKSNMDASGKPKIYDEDGRPIVSADGVIAQIERFATKFVFSKLNVGYFEKALQAMVAKSEKPQGNSYMLICNTAFYNEWQRVMNAWIVAHKTDGSFLYSKGANGYVDLGATYESYTFGGNKISVKIDRCFDVEFPTRKYAALIDLTADSATGKPAMAFFTFKGGDIIHNVIVGVGGKSGLASGEVSSPVAGSKLVNWGYGGVAVFNPYRSVIMIGEENRNSIWS
ncbi:MAG: hypothetical protein PUJ51_02895 [Clostridiales bacterium]|uniref:hypothetical protein n=1 Tax=Terrisporobacter sp. TaxID=1965305 RepID=UPI002A54D828|nr:hypothetical protein [Terrisporobacter sp.]MDD7753443.1 hypothetical protein [Clostridiales bacterium]MDY4134531.1 hypothetical protein [Terrisporobacter sp.]